MEKLTERNLWIQMQYVTSIYNENNEVSSTINDIADAVLRHELMCPDKEYFAISHDFWERFVRNCVCSLKIYGYVVVTISKHKHRMGKEEIKYYLVPEVVPATRFIVIPDEKKRFMFRFREEADEKLQMHVFWEKEPTWRGELQSDTARCKYMHEYASTLMACEEHATELNSRSRALVTHKQVVGPSTQFDLLMGGNDTALLNPLTYNETDLDTQFSASDYRYRRAMAQQGKRNMETSIRKPGFATTDKRLRPDNHAKTVELDFTLDPNHDITTAPQAHYNPNLLQLLESVKYDIRRVFGFDRETSSIKVTSAEGLLLMERRINKCIESVRLKIEHILEFTSSFLIERQDRLMTEFVDLGKQGVYLGSPMSEMTFANVQQYLTPEAKRRYVSEVYKVDLCDVDIEMCKPPVVAENANDDKLVEDPGKKAEDRSNNKKNKADTK